MQDSGYGYPPVEDRGQRLPLLLCALAATDENISPESIDALSEGAQLTDIPWNSMILVIASDHLPKPCTNPSLVPVTSTTFFIFPPPNDTHGLVI